MFRNRKDYADRLADLERERNTIELEKEQVIQRSEPGVRMNISIKDRYML